MTAEKFILDVCCGGRMIWFNKKHPNTLYVDIRKKKKGFVPERANFEIRPDKIMDFRALKLKSNSFKLVVWDPPHLKTFSKTSIMGKKFGVLQPQSYEKDLSEGFKECWRVLKDFGVLIFKWNNTEIPLKEVLSLFNETPLFGHNTGSNSKTRWLCFMKIPAEASS